MNQFARCSVRGSIAATTALVALVTLSAPSSAAAQGGFSVQIGAPVYQAAPVYPVPVPAAPVYQAAPVYPSYGYQVYPAAPVYPAPGYPQAQPYYPQQVYPAQANVGVVVGGQGQPHLNSYQKRALENCALLAPNRQAQCRADVWATVR